MVYETSFSHPEGSQGNFGSFKVLVDKKGLVLHYRHIDDDHHLIQETKPSNVRRDWGGSI
jgi:hypothetical protein